MLYVAMVSMAEPVVVGSGAANALPMIYAGFSEYVDYGEVL